MNIILGARRLDRTLDDAEGLLLGYRTDDGLRYLDYRPVSDPDSLVPDDLAVTILINSRVGPTAFKSVQDFGTHLPLANLDDTPLEVTTAEQREVVADLVAQMASWKGFAASVATKILHKKRPALIPILDNQAIFGAYMNPAWPERPSRADSIYSRHLIREALDWIHTDLTRPENQGVWEALRRLEPARSRIELFDMVWWTHFRRLEPVPPSRPI
jgi:hypothetical protein